jgi:hypothetical protein
VAQKENYSDAAEPNMERATLETASLAEDALEVDPSTFHPPSHLNFPVGMTGIEERNYWIRNFWVTRLTGTEDLNSFSTPTPST